MLKHSGSLTFEATLNHYGESMSDDGIVLSGSGTIISDQSSLDKFENLFGKEYTSLLLDLEASDHWQLISSDIAYHVIRINSKRDFSIYGLEEDIDFNGKKTTFKEILEEMIMDNYFNNNFNYFYGVLVNKWKEQATITEYYNRNELFEF